MKFKMMKTFAILIAMFLAVELAQANPVRPGQWLTLKKQDGTTVRATPVGDEHGHYLRGEDGEAYNKAQDADYYITVDAQQIEATAKSRRMQLNKWRPAMQLHVGKFPIGGYKGKKKGLVLLVNFQDLKMEAAHTQELFNRILNEKDFTMQAGDGYYNRFIGSLYDYFYAQSYGQFELTFDVVGPVTVSKNYAYYGANLDGLNHTQGGRYMHPDEMVEEAVVLAKQLVNNSDYDWDGDGTVDALYVIYDGYEESGRTDMPDVIWPHHGSLLHTMTQDGVKLSEYSCSGELNFNGLINGIGTMAHEFSHTLGLPDFYNVNYGSGDGMNSSYDLMHDGNHLGNGYWPCAYTGYERWMFGWKEPIELKETDDLNVTGLQPISSGGDFYVMYNPNDRNQYFMMENRYTTGWDNGLPCTGLMIYRVMYDEGAWTSNQVNTNADLQRMLVMNAGNYRGGMVDGVLYPFEGNPYFGVPGNNSFGPTTTPAAVFPSDGSESKKFSGEVSNIECSGRLISFHYKGTNELTSTYKRVTTVEAGRSYLIVAPLGGKMWAAKPIDMSKWYGYIYPVEVEDNNGIIKTELTDIVFTLLDADGGNYYLVDGNGRYIYQTKDGAGAWYNSFNVNSYIDDEVQPFSITVQSDGTIKLTNTQSQYYFQCTLYNDVPEFGLWGQAASDRSLPFIYEKVNGVDGINGTAAKTIRPAASRKVIENGRLIIIRADGKKYNLWGMEVE